MNKKKWEKYAIFSGENANGIVKRPIEGIKTQKCLKLNKVNNGVHSQLHE